MAPVNGAPPANAAPAEPAAEQDDDNVAFKANNANFWAQRFAAAGAPAKSASAQPESPVPAEADREATLQQPALPRGAQPPQLTAMPHSTSQRGTAQPPPVQASAAASAAEGLTEQLPPVFQEDVASGQSTALVPYPSVPDYDSPYPQALNPEADYYEADYYEADYYEAEYYEADYPAAPQVEDPYDFDSYDDAEPKKYADDSYDPELPVGLDAEDYADEETESEDFEEPETTSGKAWAVLALQGCAGLLGGGLVWFGFRWLWTEISVAALVAALVVTGCLVVVARKLLRTDDMQTILLAVLVGLICTVSPAALLLIG